MALVYTPPSHPSKKCPNFSLPSLDGNIYSLKDFKEKLLVFMFICNHCPYVQLIEKRLLKLIQFFKNKDVCFIGICSNDEKTYPEDSFENLKRQYKKKNYDFIYLHDKEQRTAKNFEALCTPDFFIYNQKRKQVWRGRLDNSVEDEKQVTQEEMKQALQNLLDDKKPSIEHPSFGCSIKWKSYFSLHQSKNNDYLN